MHTRRVVKTRTVWLPEVKKSLRMCSLISTEYTNVTDRQTPYNVIGRAYAWHHVAKSIETNIAAVRS